MISFENIYYSYDKKENVLEDFSLNINDNERVCLFGRSGRGKTTILRIALGLEKTDKGSVIITEGHKPSAVFQEDRLIPWKSAVSNVAMFSDEKKAARMLSRLGLEEALDLKPSELSGGMKRRVSLARALCHDFDYLVLDEPFTGLDEATKKVCIDVINGEMRERPLLFASHDRNDAALLRARIVEL